MPDMVLEEIAAANPGMTATMEPGAPDTWTLHKLLTSAGDVLLTVQEPPQVWPVRVILHHADRLHQTEYPPLSKWKERPAETTVSEINGKAVHTVVRPASGEWIPLDHYESDIDTPEKLKALCLELLENDHAKKIIAAAVVINRRAERMRLKAEAMKTKEPPLVTAAPAGPVPEPPNAIPRTYG